MKKLKIVLLSLLATILAAILFFVAVFIYTDQFKKEEIYRGTDPDSEYVFVLYQVGAPGWPFGPVKAEVRVLNAMGNTVDKESVLVYTDGARLTESYIGEINWGEKTLEIDFLGENRTSCVLEWN
ncbi:MAG: hypothetical protein IJX28_09145 [Clostridia bacterium]|nr:hypothetical protein [Clostridia bacterium]